MELEPIYILMALCRVLLTKLHMEYIAVVKKQEIMSIIEALNMVELLLNQTPVLVKLVHIECYWFISKDITYSRTFTARYS